MTLEERIEKEIERLRTVAKAYDEDGANLTAFQRREHANMLETLLDAHRSAQGEQ